MVTSSESRRKRIKVKGDHLIQVFIDPITFELLKFQAESSELSFSELVRTILRGNVYHV